MPLTITIGELSAAVRITTDPTTGPQEPYLTELARHLAVAEAQIDLYAEDAPEAVKNEAAVRFVGYLVDAPPTSRSPQNAFILSGARALLSSWREPVSALVYGSYGSYLDTGEATE